MDGSMTRQRLPHRDRERQPVRQQRPHRTFRVDAGRHPRRHADRGGDVFPRCLSSWRASFPDGSIARAAWSHCADVQHHYPPRVIRSGHLDGEPVSLPSLLTIRIVPRSLRLIVPAVSGDDLNHRDTEIAEDALRVLCVSVV